MISPTMVLLCLLPSLDEPPPELTRQLALGQFQSIVSTDVEKAGLAWSTKTKSVTIRRAERETSTSSWSKQDQRLTTSYFITGAQARVDQIEKRISDVYVAGVFDDGTVVIERWKLTYTQAGIPGGGGYVLLEDRPLPMVNRSVLFSGVSIGHIQALEVDPRNRFLLLKTFESDTLYKLALPSGDLTTILTPQAEPQLREIRTIYYGKHTEEGPIYILTEAALWETHAMEDDDAKTMVLSDPDDDGVFDSITVMTKAQWAEAGYHVHSNWIWNRLHW